MLNRQASSLSQGQLLLPPAKDPPSTMQKKSIQYIQLNYQHSKEAAALFTDGQLLLASDGITPDDLFQLGESLATSLDIDYYSLRIDNDDLDEHAIHLEDLMDDGPGGINAYKLARAAMKHFFSYFRYEHESTAKQLSKSTAKDWTIEQASELALHLNRQPEVLMSKIFWAGDLRDELLRRGYSPDDDNQILVIEELEGMIGHQKGAFERAMIEAAIDAAEYQLTPYK